MGAEEAAECTDGRMAGGSWCLDARLCVRIRALEIISLRCGCRFMPEIVSKQRERSGLTRKPGPMNRDCATSRQVFPAAGLSRRLTGVCMQSSAMIKKRR